MSEGGDAALAKNSPLTIGSGVAPPGTERCQRQGGLYLLRDRRKQIEEIVIDSDSAILRREGGDTYVGRAS